MRSWIHPKYYNSVKVVCICDAETTINGSTVEWPIRIESCPSCHPRYAGKKVNKVVKWRKQQYLERLEKMKKLKEEK